MLKIGLNGKESLDYEEKDGKMFLNGEELNWDIQQNGERSVHVLEDGRGYNVEIISFDKAEKKITVRINGQTVETTIKDRFDLLLEQMGMADMGKVALKNIKAPMPGLIHEILVSEGDEVAKGDQLLILEAMKMENIIKSPGEGIIRAIKVKKGETVDKNQVIIEF